MMEKVNNIELGDETNPPDEKRLMVLLGIFYPAFCELIKLFDDKNNNLISYLLF